MLGRTDISVCPFRVGQTFLSVHILRLEFVMKQGQAGMPVLQRHRPTRVIVGPVGRENRKAPALIIVGSGA